ncbi:MAG: hypothetical protein LBN02_05400 [Oscillospiraceae bacterium]|jgi:hypothetical protein|nr:hypothetical protein [Oscillospiraceae bacterium]
MESVSELIADSLRIFATVAVANIRFTVNPIRLTLVAGLLGAIFIR